MRFGGRKEALEGKPGRGRRRDESRGGVR